MFPVARVPFGVPSLDPQPYEQTQRMKPTKTNREGAMIPSFHVGYQFLCELHWTLSREQAGRVSGRLPGLRSFSQANAWTSNS